MKEAFNTGDIADYWIKEEMFNKWRGKIFISMEKAGFWVLIWQLSKKSENELKT